MVLFHLRMNLNKRIHFYFLCFENIYAVFSTLNNRVLAFNPL